MIEVRQLVKKFGKLEVLKGLDLNVHKGSIYGLVGANGAGKTTLLKLIAGIYRPDQGSILVEGQQVFENNRVKENIIFIPDDLFYFSQYSIRETADFFRQVYPTWDEDRFTELTEVFGIDVKRRVTRLSKGMKRQVAFWLALSVKPRVLILDEPLDGLDPMIRSRVKKLLLADVAEREMSILISSHNLRELEDICDYMGILHDGRIIIESELDTLKRGISKVQIAFSEGIPEELLKAENILYHEKRGSVHLLIMRGDEQAIKTQVQAFNPLLLDVLPLTFEEIFVYEMGGVGYDIRNIL
ncbi:MULTISPECIES: ABC transporter ATP-binding protein [unclassified Carboxydocella]|uniref:ABC transporter ATP-binding protein n=1 Tax=unclassified Carboxydocella TaxID=2685367 RepID=UPI0009AE06D2|nr:MULTISPECIES: ABC transporter ATP-binding protein [unclassified Carboxydocella]GAW28566.1 ABC transporter [Carboxydocella sp. ULO1]GAW30656.1 ABC transporter [Carboxydocella sp. JDF658]